MSWHRLAGGSFGRAAKRDKPSLRVAGPKLKQHAPGGSSASEESRRENRRVLLSRVVFTWYTFSNVQYCRVRGRYLTCTQPRWGDEAESLALPLGAKGLHQGRHLHFRVPTVIAHASHSNCTACLSYEFHIKHHEKPYLGHDARNTLHAAAIEDALATDAPPKLEPLCSPRCNVLASDAGLERSPQEGEHSCKTRRASVDGRVK